MLPHRQLFWNAVNTVWACDLGPEDRALAFLPLFHTGGLNCLATPTLYRGGTVVLMESFDPERALEVIEQNRITATVAVPTMYRMLADAGLDGRDLSSLHTLLCGGAPCPDRLLDTYLDRGLCFRQGFGMTEVGPNCFSLPPWMVGRLRGSVGQPVLHGDARIVDDDGDEVAVDEVGELCLTGPHMCNGYWQDPEATQATMRDGWMHTGDYARRDEEGWFYIAGRKKEMFISGGGNVYPAEVENMLLDCPGVDQVAVVAVPDSRWGEVGLSVVVGEAEVDAVRSFCADRLARFKVPKRVVRVDDLPRNASGKVLKPVLRERFT
jgi:fatty-acyl-CoA synthase